MSIRHLSVLLVSLYCLWAKELPREKLIKGGKYINITSAPHHVTILLIYEIIEASICGGFIIAERWVVTAAHCFDKAKISKQVSIKVLAGVDDMTQEGFVTEVDYGRIHEDFYLRPTIKGDICVLLTVDAFPFSDRIQAAVLPPANTTIDSLDKMMVTGFGFTHDLDWRMRLRLKGLDVVRVPKDDCLKEFHNFLTPGLYHSSFCVISQANDWNQTTCFGDSGGPFFAKDANGSFVAFGFLHGGKYQECLGMSLAVFLPFYVEWIKESIEFMAR